MNSQMIKTILCLIFLSPILSSCILPVPFVVEGIAHSNFVKYTEKIIDRANSSEYDLLEVAYTDLYPKILLDEQSFSERFKKHSQFREVQERRFTGYKEVYGDEDIDLNTFVFIDKLEVYQEMIIFVGQNDSCIFYVKYNTQTKKVEKSYYKGLNNTFFDCVFSWK